MAQAVNAGGVGFGLFFMAEGTIRRRQRGAVSELFDAAVAVHARKVGMNGMRKGLGWENQRLRFSIHDPGQVGIKMALQTILVGDFFGRVGPGSFLGQRTGIRQSKKGE